MHGGGGAALRTHRSYLAISHRNIVLSRLARWEGLRSPSPARAIYTAAGTLAEGASTSGADDTGDTGDTGPVTVWAVSALAGGGALLVMAMIGLRWNRP